MDILGGVLSGAAYTNRVYPQAADGRPLPSATGHFFGAWRVDAFRPIDEYRMAMDDLQRILRATPKADGQGRIYIHGEKEVETADRRAREGIPLDPEMVADLRQIADEVGVAYDLEG